MKKRKLVSPIKTLRSIMGWSQVNFANNIGVSVQAIASLETGRIPITEKMMRKIRVATGAEFDGIGISFRYTPNPSPDYLPQKSKPQPALTRSGKVYFLWHGTDTGPRQEYRKEHFTEHRKRMGYDDLGPDKIADSFCAEIRRMFRAAAQNNGKLRHRLPALAGSLMDWMEDANVDFSLNVDFPLE